MITFYISYTFPVWAGNSQRKSKKIVLENFINIDTEELLHELLNIANTKAL